MQPELRKELDQLKAENLKQIKENEELKVQVEEMRRKAEGSLLQNNKATSQSKPELDVKRLLNEMDHLRSQLGILDGNHVSFSLFFSFLSLFLCQYFRSIIQIIILHSPWLNKRLVRISLFHYLAPRPYIVATSSKTSQSALSSSSAKENNSMWMKNKSHFFLSFSDNYTMLHQINYSILDMTQSYHHISPGRSRIFKNAQYSVYHTLTHRLTHSHMLIIREAGNNTATPWAHGSR